MRLVDAIRNRLWRMFGRQKCLSVSRDGALFLTLGWRQVEVFWEQITQVDVWQIDALVHVIGVNFRVEGRAEMFTIDELNGWYPSFISALKSHLPQFDQAAWDYVHSDFFADVTRTVYRRSQQG